MQAFQKFRFKIANYIIGRRLKSIQRERELLNLKYCKKILLLTSSISDHQGEEIRRMKKYLMQDGKEVVSLLSVHHDKDSDNLEDPDNKLLKKSDLNFWFIPSSEAMAEVMEEDFDLLIDLSLADDFPVKAIFALSKAKLKAAAAISYRNEFGDVLIDIKSQPQTAYLITQLKHYLSQINQDQHVA